MIDQAQGPEPQGEWGASVKRVFRRWWIVWGVQVAYAFFIARVFARFVGLARIGSAWEVVLGSIFGYLWWLTSEAREYPPGVLDGEEWYDIALAALAGAFFLFYFVPASLKW